MAKKKSTSQAAAIQKYDLPMRVMHWVMGFFIIGALAAGLIMANLSNDNPVKYDIYAWHKSFGVLIFALACVRLFIRMGSKIPPYPAELKKSDVMLSKAIIVLFYCFMFIIPITGYLMSAASGRAVQFFGLSLPNLVAPNPSLAKAAWVLHGYIAYALIIAIVLHLAGNVKHYMCEKVNLLKRMW